MRRAVAIQLIINREWGFGEESEPESVEASDRATIDRSGGKAVLAEFDSAHRARRRARRNGETGYQRGRMLRTRSMLYEHRKHDGSYPIVA